MSVAIIHEATSVNPDPTSFMPIEVTSAFPEGDKSTFSSQEKAQIDRFINEVPDVNDPLEINYWQKMGDREVYLEGWIDQCLAGTGFPPMEGGEWDEKIEYMVRDTHRTLIAKQTEKTLSPDEIVAKLPLTLIEGGFREFEAGTKSWLYGVSWGVYQPYKSGNPGTAKSLSSLREEGEAIVARLGNGVGYYGPWLPDGAELYPEGTFLGHFFQDDAVTKTSFVARTYEDAKTKLIKVRKDFGAEPPVFSNPGEVSSSSMDEIRARQIAEEAAVKAVELHGQKIAEQVAKEMSGEMIHQSPISPHCERVLEALEKGGIPCWDFRLSRSAVLCKAWEILEKEKRTKLPVGEAWSYLRAKCKVG